MIFEPHVRHIPLFASLSLFIFPGSFSASLLLFGVIRFSGPGWVKFFHRSLWLIVF